MKLYPIFDESFLKSGESIDEYINALNFFKDYIQMVQLRFKNIEDKKFYEFVCDFKHRVDEDLKIIVNDRVDICLACELDGVHVGEKDLPPDIVRKLLGNKKIIGFSPKSFESAEKYLDYVNYFGIGSVFPSFTKSEVKVIGIEGLKRYIETFGNIVDIYAIGGISFDNVIYLKNVGIKGISFISLWKEKPFEKLKKIVEVLK